MTEAAPPAEPMVVFDKVSKRFGPLEVLREFSLAVAPQERLSIMGPSGSGKSTALRLLMTLERPTGGDIRVGGESLWRCRRGERWVSADERHLRRMRGRIGYVFQHFNLFPHMSVLQNVTEAPIHAQKVPRERALAEARELLAMVGLSEKADSYPGQLSGGQQQRVAIARTLATRPEILLCDEPTSALDIELVGEVLEVLRNLARQTAMTMIFVTHEIRFAREVSDRIVFMDAGQVLESGTPDAILGAPQHERTKSFLKAVLKT